MNIDERAAALAVEVRKATDSKVLTGLFAGMVLPEISGLSSPYYLGTYEHELHNVISAIAAKDYDCIYNVGCGFGYYAAGLARLKPTTAVHAYDKDPVCMTALRETLVLNYLKNVTAGKYFLPSDGPDLLIMDIEGDEDDELLPSNYADCDILVESHECIKPGVTQRIIDRYAPTHNIDIIHNKFCAYDLQQLFPGAYIEHFDNSIVTWEGRGGPTPWLWMQKRDDATTKVD